jgi:cytidylate kinase
LGKRFVITIDGPAGSGKSTVSRLLARKLNYLYLDTGALYRALAFQTIKEGISVADEAGIAELCRRVKIRLRQADDMLRVYAHDEDVTEKIRTEHIGLLASTLSAIPVVRYALLPLQRDSGKDGGGVIAEGRDMGTVVFPDADLKFFLEADEEERIRRRFRELVLRMEKADYPSVKKDLLFRDKQDRERAISPLKVPEGAMIIDTTQLTIDEVVEVMLAEIVMQ